MGTSAFDKMWDDGPKTVAPSSSFDKMWGDETPADKLHRLYKEGKLAGQQQRAGQRDIANAQDEIDAQPSYLQGVATRAAGAGAALADMVPGAERLEALARSKVRGDTYEQALADIRQGKEDSGTAGTIAKWAPMVASLGATSAPGVVTSLLSKIPAAGRVAQAAGAVGNVVSKTPGAARVGAAMETLPGSVATYMGADRALRADPDETWTDKALGTVGRAALGYAGGLGGELAATAIKSKIARTIARNVLDRVAARTEAATPAYDAFNQLGDLGMTPKLSRLMDLPAVKSAISAAKGQSQLAGLSDTDARVLDEAYKLVGNKAWRAQNNFQAGNTANDLKAAIDEAAQNAGGSYSAAVDPFAQASREIRAVKAGNRVVNNSIRPSGTAETQVEKSSPEAFSAWLKNPNTTQPEIDAAIEGIKGNVGQGNLLARAQVPFTHLSLPMPLPSSRLMAGNRLLREAGDPLLGNAGRAIMSALHSPPNVLGANSAMGGGQMGLNLSTINGAPQGPQTLSGILRNPAAGTPMPSGAFKQLPESTMPVSGRYQQEGVYGKVKGLLGERSRWASEPDVGLSHTANDPAARIPMGEPVGPPRPAGGELSPDEKFQRALQWANQQRAARGPEPFDMGEFTGQNAENTAREHLAQVARETAQKQAEFQRNLTQASAEAHRNALARGATKAMADKAAKDAEQAVTQGMTTQQRLAREALLRRALQQANNQ